MEKFERNLRDYLVNDEIYTMYLEGRTEGFSDFDNFCVAHCEDIVAVLREYRRLKSERDALVEALSLVRQKNNRDKQKYRKKAREYRFLYNELKESKKRN